MVHNFIAKESKENDAAEAFGITFDVHVWHQGVLTAANYNCIVPNESMTVLFKPLGCILNQNKRLPLLYAPITMELELVDDKREPIISGQSAYDLPNEANFCFKAFNEGNTSVDWQINNVQVKCDVCTLDNALDNSYAQHLLQGKSLPITYNTFVSQMQTISGQDAPLINVSRALTRLKSVFVTLNKDLTGGRANLIGRKNWNALFSPMSRDNEVGYGMHQFQDGEFELQLQIGSTLFPEYHIRSHTEAYYQLKKTLGVQASAVHNFDLSALQYRDNKFILATDCEGYWMQVSQVSTPEPVI
jgi:hypothetical protein